MGPVISVACATGGETKVTPSPMASNPSVPGAEPSPSAWPCRSSANSVHCVRADRPGGLGARLEPVGMAHLEQHLRLLGPVGGWVLLEEMVEEAALQVAAVIGVEMRPVLDAVRLQPLLGRGSAHEAFEVAARVQTLAAPVGGGQERHGNARPVGRAGAVILVVQRMGEDVVAEIAAVGIERRVVQRVGTADQFAGHRAARAALPRPCCTVLTCMSYQLAQKVLRMPP